MGKRTRTIPAFDLQPAIERLKTILGPEGLLTADSDISGFRDPFQHPSWRDFEPGAVLMPASVEEVQAIVRLANECKVPLWTSSQGRNNNYGGAAPRVSGSLVLSMRRMNRVLEVDENNATALIEPGVSFFDLYNHLRAIGAKLWMSVPDLGWGSIVGNTLDHGVGYTPTGDHVGQQCGMEVVLASGEILRTGTGAMSNARAALVHKRNCGPSADGLFMQSNYGIVTKMGLWLMQPPECYMPGWRTLRKDSDPELLLKKLRPLMMNGTIPNQPIPGATVSLSKYDGRNLPELENPHERVQAGIPSMALDRMTRWIPMASFRRANRAFGRRRIEPLHDYPWATTCMRYPWGLCWTIPSM